MRRTISVVLTLTSLAILSGCDSDGSEEMRKKQDAALKDPFSYGPDADQMINATPTSSDRPDVSGGGLFDLDRDALNHDWKLLQGP